MNIQRWTPEIFMKHAMTWIARPQDEFLARWKWKPKSKEWGGGMLETRLYVVMADMAATTAVVEVHIVLSASYGMPILYVRGTNINNPLQDVTKELIDHKWPTYGEWMMDIHPILQEAFYTPHSCMTGEALHVMMMQNEKNDEMMITAGLPLLAWWSLVGPLIEMGLSPQEHSRVLLSIQSQS